MRKPNPGPARGIVATRYGFFSESAALIGVHRPNLANAEKCRDLTGVMFDFTTKTAREACASQVPIAITVAELKQL